MNGRNSQSRCAGPSFVRRLSASLTCAVVALSLAGCVDAEPRPGPAPTSASPSDKPLEREKLTLGVYGPTAELAAWKEVVDRFNRTSEVARVELATWPAASAAREALEAGAQPDVFMSSRADLDELIETSRIQPVSELLDEREVDFGDFYERTTLQAYSRDSALQCMPYSSTPQALYYNTDLIDFDAMAARDLPVPTFEEGRAPRWNFEQFVAAADFAAKPRRNIRSFFVEQDLAGLAPYVYAGGASVFDDEEAPTSTALASDESRAALERLLPVFRLAKYSLTKRQRSRATPVDWFQRGKLAMLPGDPSLIPLLEDTPGLNWDVMPFPRLAGFATVGDIHGLCMAADAPPGPAADLIVHAISEESVATVADAGYSLPTNLAVSASEEFYADRSPGARVFQDSVAQLELAPLLSITPELEAAAEPALSDLFNSPVIDVEDIERLTDQIDTSSQAVLNPETAADESESP
ncbi:MAG: ABC transporter substrate-binding protein [Nocardioides sp.]